MAFSIRTDTAALNSVRNRKRTDTGLTTSLERLSTGLRVNKAADDSSGLVIADSLRAQAKGLGQAIRNANDAISIVQIADAALDESIEIMNQVKVKSIQAAQDGQTTESRKAIQSDIDLLIQELDEIAKTTSFNGQKLLSGSFTSKAFQIGAYSGEKIDLSIDPATSSKIGHLTTGQVVVEGNKEGLVYLGIKGGLSQGYKEIPSTELKWDNNPEHGMGALADAVNKMADVTGVSAEASVVSKTDTNIKAGMTDSDFSINTIGLGSVSVMENDADGSLVKAINEKTVQHGVVASVNEGGHLVLTATDGRGILVEPPPGRGTGIDTLFSGKSLSTFGELNIQSRGPALVDVKDLGGGEPVALADNGLDVKADAVTVQDSLLTKGSVLAKGSIMASPWTADQNFTGDRFSESILIEEQTVMVKGSVLGPGSIVLSESELPDRIMISARGTTDAASFVTKDSLLKTDSILGAGTELPAGNIVSAGTLYKGDATIAATAPSTAPSLVRQDSVLTDGTLIASGTILKGTAVVRAMGPTAGSASLRTSSMLTATSTIASGTTIQGVAVMGAVAGTGSSYTLSTGSSLVATSTIAAGSAFGGSAQVNAIAGTTGDSTIANLSTLQTNSVIASGTTLTGTATINTTGTTTTNFVLANGSVLRAGSDLGTGTTIGTTPAVVGTTNLATGSLTLTAGSVIQSGSILGVGTNLTNSAVIKTIAAANGYNVAATSTLVAGTVFGNGTLVNGTAIVNTLGPTGNLGDTISLGAGTRILAGSFIQAGNSINTTGGLRTGPYNFIGFEDTVGGPQSLSVSSGILNGGSTLANGSAAGTPGFSLQNNMNPTGVTVMGAGSSLANGTTLAAGSIIGANTAEISGNMNLGNAMTLNAGSTLATGSSLASATVIGNDTVTLASDMNVAGGGITLAAGSDLANNTIMAQSSVVGAQGVSLAGSMTLTGGAMTLRAQSTLAGGSQLNQGSSLSDNAVLNTSMLMGVNMTLGAGSTIGLNTVLNTGSVVGADGAQLQADMTVGSTMTLAAGSSIAANSSFSEDTVFASDAMTLASSMVLSSDMSMTTGSKMGQGSQIEYGSYFWADATLISSMTLQDPMKLASDMRLASDIVLGEGSRFGVASILEKGSSVYHPLTLMTSMEMEELVLLDKGSEISENSDTLILSGMLVGGDAELSGALVLENDFNLGAGSTIATSSVLRNGSGIGGIIETAYSETVAKDSEMSLGRGTVLAKGSMMSAGTFLTSEVKGLDGKTYPRGIFLEKDLLIDESVLSGAMTLGSESVIAPGSLLALNSDGTFVASSTEDMKMSTLSNIQVLTQDDAQRAIGISDAALRHLDEVRANLGSVQNQLTSAIAGITATKINVHASESVIRDVDFAEEFQNFSKLQILAEAGQFALSSSGERSSYLMELLTQTDQR